MCNSSSIHSVLAPHSWTSKWMTDGIRRLLSSQASTILICANWVICSLAQLLSWLFGRRVCVPLTVESSLSPCYLSGTSQEKVPTSESQCWVTSYGIGLWNQSLCCVPLLLSTGNAKDAKADLGEDHSSVRISHQAVTQGVCLQHHGDHAGIFPATV